MLLKVSPVLDGAVPRAVGEALGSRGEVVERELGPESRGLLVAAAADEVKRQGAGGLWVEVGSRTMRCAVGPHSDRAVRARTAVQSQVVAVIVRTGAVTLRYEYGHAEEAQENHVTFRRSHCHAAPHQGRVLHPSVPVRGLQIS